MRRRYYASPTISSFGRRFNANGDTLRRKRVSAVMLAARTNSVAVTQFACHLFLHIQIINRLISAVSCLDISANISEDIFGALPGRWAGYSLSFSYLFKPYGLHCSMPINACWYFSRLGSLSSFQNMALLFRRFSSALIHAFSNADLSFLWPVAFTHYIFVLRFSYHFRKLVSVASFTLYELFHFSHSSFLLSIYSVAASLSRINISVSPIIIILLQYHHV